MLAFKIVLLHHCAITIQAGTSTRISQGRNAEKYAWPLNALLRVAYGTLYHICGGSLVSDQWVLTAAHCFVDEMEGRQLNLAITQVWFGVHDRSEMEEGVSRRISKIVKHPKYDPLHIIGKTYDIALVMLDKPLEINDVDENHVTPIKLDKRGDVIRHHCYTMGFGVLSSSQEKATILQEIQIREYDRKLCGTHYDAVSKDRKKVKKLITDRQICMVAGNSIDTQRPSFGGSCFGDSGAPLVCNHNGEWLQVGVTKGGGDCGEGLPTVFQLVHKYMKFIKTATETECNSSNKHWCTIT